MSVTSIEETSGSPLSGYTGESVDYSSLSFEATYDDESTGSVTPTSCTPSVWGEPGTETITFNFADTDVTCEVEGESLAPVTLDHITITGDFTNAQYRGSAPDLTGLTIKAVYTDESEETLTSSDYEVSPAVWPEGNPDNLTQERVTISYTEDEVTKSAYKQPVLHYPETNLSLSVSEAGHHYFDFTTEQQALTWKGASDVAQNGATAGDNLFLFLPKTYYDDGTTYPASQLMTDVAAYGVALSSSGTPGTEGFVPEWGYSKSIDSEDCYFAVSISGEGTGATYASPNNIIYMIWGTAANNIGAGDGWKLSDITVTKAVPVTFTD